MLLIVAIIQDYDADSLLRALAGRDIGVTRIASTGGFLRMGNTTVFIGIEEVQKAECIELLRATCRNRIERPAADAVDEFGLLGAGAITEVPIGGAVVFTVPVERFERFGPA